MCLISVDSVPPPLTGEGGGASNGCCPLAGTSPLLARSVRGDAESNSPVPRGMEARVYRSKVTGEVWEQCGQRQAGGHAGGGRWDGRWVACCHALGPGTAEGRGPDRVPTPLPRRFPMARGAAIPGSAGSRTGAVNGHVRAPTPAGGMSSRACQRAKGAGRGGAQ